MPARSQIRSLRPTLWLAAVLIAATAAPAQPPHPYFPGAREGSPQNPGSGGDIRDQDRPHMDTQSQPPQPAPAASTLPPTPATPAPSATTPSVPVNIPGTPGSHHPQRAIVRYEHGLLTVSAYNSSLNQVLRAIINTTGLMEQGGVGERRVYGIFGPDTLPNVLSQILQGSGVNIVYAPAAEGRPAELDLTQRNGGVQLPGPNDMVGDDASIDPPAPDALRLMYSATSASAADTTDHPAEAVSVPTEPPPATPTATPSAATQNPMQNPAQSTVNPAPTTMVTTTPAQSPAPPVAVPAASTPPTNPNQIKTPEQILQEILDIQKQRAKAAATMPKTPPATPAAPAPPAPAPDTSVQPKAVSAPSPATNQPTPAAPSPAKQVTPTQHSAPANPAAPAQTTAAPAPPKPQPQPTYSKTPEEILQEIMRNRLKQQQPDAKPAAAKPSPAAPTSTPSQTPAATPTQVTPPTTK